MTLTLLADDLTVCRLDSQAAIPSWAVDGSFFSVTRTSDELSVVCSSAQVPLDVRAENGWRAFKVEGPLDFSLTGILSSIARPLADARVSLFAISTFDTDYILVKDVDAAGEALRAAGFHLV